MTNLKIVILMIIFIFLTTSYQAIADEEVLSDNEITKDDVIGEIIDNSPEILIEEENNEASRVIPVTVTAYTLKECHQNKGITASGKRVRPGIVAVSPDLEKLGLRLGSKVKLKGIGTFHVMDRTSPRLKKTIDIYMINYKEALKFGKRRDVMASIY